MNKTIFVLTAHTVQETVEESPDGKTIVQTIAFDPAEWREIRENHPDAYVKVLTSDGEELGIIPVRPAYDWVHAGA